MSITRRAFIGSSVCLPIAIHGSLAIGQATGVKRIRRNVGSLNNTSSDLSLYRVAVAALVNLPNSDPRNWNRLAAQHQDHCPHSNWWFLPWHRAYLYYFERVCQDILNNPSFALPYWDWTRSPRIPGPFWSGILNGNGISPALNREISANTDIPSEFVGQEVISRLMNTGSLQTIYSGKPSDLGQRTAAVSGEFEGTPHNNVHAYIGGVMGNYLSPLDPIFWLHHANMDRLWASWQKSHANATPSDSTWESHPLEKFYDPVKKMDISEPSANTISIEKYNYEYDRTESASSGLSVTKTIPVIPGKLIDQIALVKNFVTTTANVISPVPISKAEQVALTAPIPLQKAVSEAIAVNSSKEKTKEAPDIQLVLEGVKRPVGKNVALRVFINCKNPGIGTPIDDPSYVSTIGFFGDEHDNHGASGSETAGRSYSLDATETLARLSAVGAYNGTNIDVALVPFGIRGKTTNEVLRPAKIALIAIKGT